MYTYLLKNVSSLNPHGIKSSHLPETNTILFWKKVLLSCKFFVIKLIFALNFSQEPPQKGLWNVSQLT